MCVSVHKPVRGDFTINMYVWQTDQWLLKRSRGDDDDRYWFCVLIKSDHADKLQIHIPYIQYVCTHAHTRRANDRD